MNNPASREESIFHAALEISDRVARAAYLRQACGEDAGLRQRIEGLLRSTDQTQDFLEKPAAGVRPAAQAGLPDGPGTLAGPTEKPGDQIGHYKLLEQIGEGGCGVVYMAEQTLPIRRRVALKVIKLGMDTKDVIARFEAERQALALMDHENIARVFDAGATATGRPYFVMELVRGIKITDYCDQNNLPTRARLDLFMKVCQAIQHAHQKGIIHRDIKPSNILVTLHDGEPVPKVIDFGIAKATNQQRLTDKTLFTAFRQFIGTPAYMSPEQAEMSGLDIDTRSDIYSLGVLLYELLTGQTPFDGKELLAAGLDEMRRTIREKEPPKPSTRLGTMLDVERTNTASRRQTDAAKLVHLVRGDLDWIVMKCLEKDRSRRYVTANGVAVDIQRHLNNEPVWASPPSGIYQLRKMVRRNKGTFAAAGAVTAALIFGLGLSAWQFSEKRKAYQHVVAAEKKARTEASKSQQVANFLKDMLEGVDSSVALGRETAILREIVDKAAERVGRDLNNQPDVEIELRHVVGGVYLDIGEYAKAEEMQRQALAMQRKNPVTSELDFALSLHELAAVLIHRDRLVEAEKMARGALGIRRRLLGEEDRAVLGTLHLLARVLDEQRRLPEAEITHRDVLRRARELRSPDLEYVANALGGLANNLHSQAKLEEAERLHRESLDIYRRLHAGGHPKVVLSLHNLTAVLIREGKLAEAEVTARDALAMQKKLLGETHPNVATGINNLAYLLRKQGKPAEAEPLDRQALAIYRIRLENDHPQVATSLNNLASDLQEQGKAAEAEPLARECLAICEKRFKEDWPTFNARSILGGILLAQKKYSDAEPLLLSSYEGMKLNEGKMLANGRIVLMQTVQRLTQLHQDWGKPEKAAEWQQKLETLGTRAAPPPVAPPAKPQ